MSADQSKKYFCNICRYCFLECWVKPNNISRAIFRFLSLIIGVFKINFERTSLQTSENRHIHILLCWISPHLSSSFSTVSLGWNSEFALWRLVGGLINYECKEAYKKIHEELFSAIFKMFRIVFFITSLNSYVEYSSDFHYDFRIILMEFNIVVD